MTRQYIGARYVPKFFTDENGSSDWRDNIPYEALSIVMYLGNSYTSKKSVPVGVQITNAEYWALTGNYNGQVEGYRQEVEEVNINVNKLDNILVTNNITLNGYAIFIGDSYTSAGSLGNSTNQRFSTQLSTMLKLIEKNYAVGSCGFVQGSTPYTAQMNNAVTDFNDNNIDKTLVKYVFVCGNRNDGEVSDKGAYIQAVNNTLATAESNFPNAKIIVIPMLWDATYMPTQYLQTINLVKEGCLYGLGRKTKIIDNAYTWLSGRFEHILYQNGANVHPDVYGHYIIARHIYSAIDGSKYDDSSWVSFSPSLATNVTDFNGEIRRENGKMHIHFQFKVSDAISGDLFSLTATNSPIGEFYLGNQRFFVNVNERSKQGNAYTYDPIKAYIDSNYNKTGDTSGTYTLTCKPYNGTLAPDDWYYCDLEIPVGVKNNVYSIT